MSKVVRVNLIRTVLIILLQGLVLQRVYLGWFNYLSLIVYPLIIIMLPLKTWRIWLLLIGFIVGLSVDLFYGSFGVHAGACVFAAFMRPFVLLILEPRGGYPSTDSPLPTLLGMTNFARYAAIILFLHLLFYFSLEVFMLAYFGQILLKTVVSFAVSYLAIMSFVLILNPRS